jgi:hypothetical protein
LSAARAVPGLTVILGAGVAATLAFSLMNVAEPLLARGELKTGAAGFALLVCAFGVGSTIGAVRGRADGWTMLASLTGGGLALAASALVPSVELAAATFLATGVFAGAFLSSEHQLVARLAPEEVLGRVFGLKDALDAAALCTAFVIGALIASHSDARVAFAVSGASALIVAGLATVMLLREGVVHSSRRTRVARSHVLVVVIHPWTLSRGVGSCDSQRRRARSSSGLTRRLGRGRRSGSGRDVSRAGFPSSMPRCAPTTAPGRPLRMTSVTSCSSVRSPCCSRVRSTMSSG